MRAGADQMWFGASWQVAQTARALHWVVKTLRDSGFGSDEGAPSLGEWVAVLWSLGTVGRRAPGRAPAGPGGRTVEGAPACGPDARAGPALPTLVWLSPAPQTALEGQDPELDGRQKAEDLGDAHHVNARHLLYPNSRIVRFPVPNEKVPWEVSCCPGCTPPGSGAKVLGGAGRLEPSDMAGHQVGWSTQLHRDVLDKCGP